MNLENNQKIMNLPDDFIIFLKEGNQLEYDYSKCEAGRVILKPFDELECEDILVDLIQTPHMETEPHSEEDGYYKVPAVSLTGECEHYDPEYILLWLPQEKLFGSYDTDHMHLFYFPNATWDDIVKNPIFYLETQWDTRGDEYYFKPFPKYPFVEED